jgi:uncharacterized protein (TIGR03083 family)
MNPLVRAWQDAIDSFSRTVAEIPDDAFDQPSLLPGWTVGDIVAHTAALEHELAGQPLPAHEPDWDALPHADDLFSRYTELGVDVRRGWTPSQVRADLQAAVAVRSAALESEDQDDARAITGIGGLQRTFGEHLRMRCFDVVIHEIDIRDALGMPAPELGPGARICAEQIAGGLGYVWVKRAGARPGEVLHLMVPDWIDTWIGVAENGRGGVVPAGEATVTVTVPALHFIRLGSGRRGDTGAAHVTGDPERGRAVLASLNVAP